MTDKKISVQQEAGFSDIAQLITAARQRAVQAVNTTLIELYWQIGERISRKIATAEWGDGVVEQLASYLVQTQPGLRGFTRRNLFRMRQFYEAYPDPEIVSAVLTQLPWTHHLIILSQSKRPEEREFYLRLAAQERWSKRQLERQFKTALFERTVLAPPKVSPVVAQMHPDAASIFRDSYLVEFLGLPEGHAETDLHRGLLARLKDFLIELGRDFCFVGSQYPVQVGGRDFALDLLFFHRLPSWPELSGRHRSGGVRAIPQHIARIDLRIPDQTAGQSPAARQAARVLSTEHKRVG
jgi:predicted nuclease of restriction endonuclease-like (RecB) superfamily